MKPEEKQVMKIASMKDFYVFRDTLNLTDRQRDIFELRYSKGLSMQEIADEIKYSYNVVREDMKDITNKVVAVIKQENYLKDLT